MKHYRCTFKTPHPSVWYSIDLSIEVPYTTTDDLQGVCENLARRLGFEFVYYEEIPS